MDSTFRRRLSPLGQASVLVAWSAVCSSGLQWIRFENCAREDDSAVWRFDRGNLVYLWSEIFWKFLLTAFLVIAAAMGGHLILVSVLRFMFLAQVNILSFWDLFVLGFAAGIAAIAYVFKLCLEKSFDLKPLLQD